MKKLIVFLVLLCTALCCAPKHSTAPPASPVTDAGPALNEAEYTLHIDRDFTVAQVQAMAEAADAWRSFTKGRVRITTIPDLDFQDADNIAAHKAEGHAVVIAVTSDMSITAELDAPYAPMVALGVATNGPTVFLVVDRIPPEGFKIVATHEFGHTFGLPHTEVGGDVMSGGHPEPPPHTFTDGDLALCREYKFCDDAPSGPRPVLLR